MNMLINHLNCRLACGLESLMDNKSTHNLATSVGIGICDKHLLYNPAKSK